jgi:hypothetical protein
MQPHKFYDYVWTCTSCSQEHGTKPQYCQGCNFDEFTKSRREYSPTEWCARRGHDWKKNGPFYLHYTSGYGGSPDYEYHFVPEKPLKYERHIPASRGGGQGDPGTPERYFYTGWLMRVCERCGLHEEIYVKEQSCHTSPWDFSQTVPGSISF